MCVRCSSTFVYRFRSGRRSVCDVCRDTPRTLVISAQSERPCPDCGKLMTRALTAARCLTCQRERQRKIRQEARLTTGPTERTVMCGCCGVDFVYMKPPGRGGSRRICDTCALDRTRALALVRRDQSKAAYGLRPCACEHCGAKFQPSTSTHRFCCRACGAAAKRLRKTDKLQEPLGMRECPTCSVQFRQKGGTHKFCSSTCRYRSFKEGRYKEVVYRFDYRGVPVELTAARVTQIRRDFGLTPDGYKSLWKRQRGLCAICRSPLTDKPHPHIDHDAVSMRVRGLLCVGCNFALGYLKDDPKIVERAAKYLRESRSK